MGEDKKIMNFYITHGPRWRDLAPLLPGRQMDALKNRFNSNLRKMVNANTGRYEISLVDPFKSDNAVIGRYEIVMTYEVYLGRKMAADYKATTLTLNEAAELIMKSYGLK